jgi:hypothetical protein
MYTICEDQITWHAYHLMHSSFLCVSIIYSIFPRYFEIYLECILLSTLLSLCATKDNLNWTGDIAHWQSAYLVCSWSGFSYLYRKEKIIFFNYRFLLSPIKSSSFLKNTFSKF